MIRQDVIDARDKLSEEVSQYLKDNKVQIDAKVEEVARKGIWGAAGEGAKAAQGLIATVSEARILEATSGGDDKAPINFLERGIRASRAVCRIIDSNRTALGSGFLIGPGLLMTNNHVLSSDAVAEGAYAEFDYEEDADEKVLTPLRFPLNPARIFVTSQQEKLDFSIVAVSPKGLGGEDLSARGWLPLDKRRNKVVEGQPVVIIQHPFGGLKHLCLFDSVLRWRDDASPFLVYTTDTEGGSSGSPAFNRFWQVIALHHAAISAATIDAGAEGYYNRGIRISNIFAELERARSGTAAHEVQGDAAHVAAALAILEDPLTMGNGRPFAAPASNVAPKQGPALNASAGRIPQSAPPGAVFESRPTIIRVRTPADWLDNRAGYAPGFLIPDGREGRSPARHRLYVPLPTMPDWLEEDTVRLLSDPGNFELRYQHFSIVMSRSRKLALLTATNVDGGSLGNLGRKDRNPDRAIGDVEPEAASDIWYFDPRISEADQLGPRLYDETSFDYGHLVRRLDPVWGDPRTQRIANDDTFYMTNCAPHETRFHRTRRDEMTWSKLEDKVLDAARSTRKRFTIFTGPVLDPRDPRVGGVKIPTTFWKIAAYEKDGSLRAHGYMLWQEKEVATMDRPRFEGLESLEQAEEPTPIREIGRLTSLDFGPLLPADVLS